ncbi:putative membrane protein [Yoonia tamlensis]|uniref:Putative membrane protein n=1 Tax=Yoonia tamlensis TaxID=390270 RepID=A0A1I6GKI9_9RHOB|nr:DUF1304 domain-containing protein [Yoonia tamlensis]SFR42577.1 putative membrane protein [Yoonia tamlensis]
MIFTIFALIIAAIHVYIAVLEMLLWDKPRGRRVFRTTAEFAAQTKMMALNQGLYNGFLAAGILVGLVLGNTQLTAFIVSCVLVAGVVGYLSGFKTALYVQSIPAAIAISALTVGL